MYYLDCKDVAAVAENSGDVVVLCPECSVNEAETLAVQEDLSLIVYALEVQELALGSDLCVESFPVPEV